MDRVQGETESSWMENMRERVCDQNMKEIGTFFQVGGQR